MQGGVEIGARGRVMGLRYLVKAVLSSLWHRQVCRDILYAASEGHCAATGTLLRSQICGSA